MEIKEEDNEMILPFIGLAISILLFLINMRVARTYSIFNQLHDYARALDITPAWKYFAVPDLYIFNPKTAHINSFDKWLDYFEKEYPGPETREELKYHKMPKAESICNRCDKSDDCAFAYCLGDPDCDCIAPIKVINKRQSEQFPKEFIQIRSVDELMIEKEKFLKAGGLACTCDNCTDATICSAAYDLYNTNGDCIMMK